MRFEALFVLTSLLPIPGGLGVKGNSMVGWERKWILSGGGLRSDLSVWVCVCAGVLRPV